MEEKIDSLSEGKKPESRTVQEYERERQEYLDVYASDVEEPNKELKVTVVIPSCAELNSDNFWRLFRSLMYQRGIKQNKFDTIIVINNPKETAELLSRQTVRDTDEDKPTSLQRERFKENQDQLRIIGIMNEGQRRVRSGEDNNLVGGWVTNQLRENEISTTEYEADLIRRFINSKVKLQEGDMVLIEPGERYYWEGNMEMFVPCVPAWTPEQHKEVE